MTERKIPLYDLTLSRDAIAEVNRVLKSGWLTTGSKVAALEKVIARRAHVRYAAGVSSATQGLQVTLEALNVEGGDVITSPFTFVATVEAIIRAGANPVLADIDPVTLTIDPDEVLRKAGDKTRAIVPVDIAGCPADYERLVKVAEHFKLPMIADASHSLGATLKRKSTAQWTDAAVYSFQATKNLTTAEGGCVTTRHKVLHERVKLLSLHALTSNAYERRKAGQWSYDVVGVGMKANLSDVHAAIGLGQFQQFDKYQEKRRKIAQRYGERLAHLQEYLETPHEPTGVRHAWHLYIVRLHETPLTVDRNQFIALMMRAGVECGVHYQPVFELSFYQQLGYTGQYFPNATYAGRRVVSLPMYPGLSLKDVDFVCDRIEEIIAKKKR
ncbi:hypothetical protein GF377_08925 [candidate division GN15 bacterium]|nr:hypothetical protein [candidate division GN15 bacterium]